MNPEELRFESLKESRDWYFVEYAPPIAGYPFATVQLTILSDADSAEHVRIATAMEEELALWVVRYDAPVMISAFNPAGDLIFLEPEKPSSHLMGRRKDSGAVESIWGSFESTTLPVFSSVALRAIYHDIPFRTGREITLKNEEEQKKLLQGLRAARFLLVLWFAIVPVTIAILSYYNKYYVGLLGLFYSIYKGTKQFFQIQGKWHQSKWDKDKAAEDLAKNHHHYHCKRNPEGFKRLKMENFEREERESTLKEAEELKKRCP
jgi:hypothetical protein